MNTYNLSIHCVRRFLALVCLFHLATIYPIVGYYVPLSGKLAMYSNEAFNYLIRQAHEWPFSFFYLAVALLGGVSFLGITNRLFSLLTYLAVLVVENNVSPVLDGGNNIAQIVLFYLILVNEKKTDKYNNFTVVMVRLLIIFQVVAMYFTTGILKSLAPFWQKGLGVFYVLTSLEYSLPSVSNFIWEAPSWVFVLPNYLILLFQLTFPVMVFNKNLRLPYLLMGLSFHAFIGLVIGLPTFAFHVISLYFIFFNDQEIIRFWNVCHLIKHRLMSKIIKKWRLKTSRLK